MIYNGKYDHLIEDKELENILDTYFEFKDAIGDEVEIQHTLMLFYDLMNRCVKLNMYTSAAIFRQCYKEMTINITDHSNAKEKFKDLLVCLHTILNKDFSNEVKLEKIKKLINEQ